MIGTGLLALIAAILAGIVVGLTALTFAFVYLQLDNDLIGSSSTRGRIYKVLTD